jgi:hypothetical protein
VLLPVMRPFFTRYAPALLLQAAAGGAVAFGLRLGPGEWAHASAFNASCLPFLFELHIDAALPSGELLLNARTDHLNASCDCRAVTTSSDGGVTWDLPVRFDAALIEQFAERAFAAVRPLTNINADVEWRRDMVPVLVRRAFASARGTWPADLPLAGPTEVA